MTMRIVSIDWIDEMGVCKVKDSWALWLNYEL